MNAAEFEFTSDDEIAEFQPKEFNIVVYFKNFSDIVGYVDAIEGARILRPPHEKVFKFTINNNGSVGMRILIWRSRMANLWERQIAMNVVVEILGGTVKTSNIRFRDPAVHVLEFHVQPTCKIIIHGDFFPNMVQAIDQNLRNIALIDVMNTPGLVEIDAYIRRPLRKIHYNHSTSGQGTITDGLYRLTINVAMFVLNPALEIGTAARVRGKWA
ncbi:hypothetical protein HCN44_003377 [Aphidius gifuensis]|uniref:Uncharacterized protein n=1 Tax=Aphidius gifuensis TaxID=684658 RepID=A0A834XX96_APHGI|nr:hypothetical protein HCN44_003377 [Aphidius gifuensis]